MKGERVERRLTAILAADDAGYSRLMGEDEEGTLARLKAHRRELIDPKITEHHGRLVKTTGDGLLIEFPSVVEAVSCALAVQRATVERNAATPEEERITLRVGVNLGDIHRRGRRHPRRWREYRGTARKYRRTRRHLISEDAFRQVRGKVDAEFTDIGEPNLKNIARPLRVYRVIPQRPADPQPPALPLPEKPSLAVLPFHNMSGDPEQEFFSDGMTEDIITALSKVRWFFVIARNSSFTYKGHAVDVKQVGRELGVRYVLEGSVRKSGNRLRITAQLVEATTGNHIWAERYDRELADIFAVQDEITERVVAAIEPQLYAAEHYRSQRKPPESLDAWECVMRALSLVGQGTGAGNAEAEALCQHAIAIAPSYGQAHGLLAFALERRPIWSGGKTTILLEASAAARKALDLDERDPWAHIAHGMVLYRMRHHSEAERAFRRALEFNPNFALAHALLGLVLATDGAHEKAIRNAEHALRLSPIDRLIDTYASLAVSIAHFAAGRYAESVSWARNMTERYPDYHTAHFVLAAGAAMQGDMEVAAAARSTLLCHRPNFSLAWMSENNPLAGDMLNRVLEGLRRAGVPET